MAKSEQNNERSERLKERLDMQVATMRGDLRDAVLRLVRDLPDSWRKMTGGAQEDAIDRIERLSSDVIDRAVEIVTARGCEAQIVRLGKITVDKGMIGCSFTTAYSHDAMNTLCQRQNQEVALVAKDPEQFKGERGAAEADNIGDLAIPRGRPFAVASSSEE
jgi:hypothetical protein